MDAVYAYLIATAIKRLRGLTNRHSSMLVHVTRYTQVQNRVYELIRDQVDAIRNEIRHGYGKTAHDHRLQEHYQTDFIPTSAERKDGGETFDWPSVRTEIEAVLQKLQVRQINGESEDVLNYSEHKEGLYVLAVGGDKLSRGLTLDDLAVSYYLRTSKMYDTLMQMGRWFGYRDGYLDLCRIYTTQDLSNQFFHIAMAMESLRAQLDEMAERGETPEEYVVQINSHPDLRITSPNKMRSAVLVKESYSAKQSQTVIFDNSRKFFADNFAATEAFLKRIGAEKTLQQGAKEAPDKPIAVGMGHYCWTGVSSDDVCAFLREYKTSLHAPGVQAHRLLDYIEKRNEDGELTEWTVVVINSGKETDDRQIAGLRLRSGVTRKGERYQDGSQFFNLRILTSGNHEFLDYTPALWEQAKAILEPEEKGPKKDKANLAAKARALRSSKQGMLLLYPLSMERDVLEQAQTELHLTNEEIPIGMAVSFPKSEKAKAENGAFVNRSLLGDR